MNIFSEMCYSYAGVKQYPEFLKNKMGKVVLYVAALVGMLLCSMTRQQLNFGQIYLLSLYAKTLPLLIKGILQLAGIGTLLFFIIGLVIAGAYLYFAFKHMDKLDEEQFLKSQIMY